MRKRENFAVQDQTENPTASVVNQAHNFNLDVKLNSFRTGPFKNKRNSVLKSSLTGKATEHQVSALLKAIQSISFYPAEVHHLPGQNYLCAETSKLPLAELILRVEAQLNQIISSSQNWLRSKAKLLKISAINRLVLKVFLAQYHARQTTQRACMDFFCCCCWYLLQFWCYSTSSPPYYIYSQTYIWEVRVPC